ncbi:MAG: alkaline phosphatase family protein [Pirellulales bacterium]|nr:alkaline phosphatase family protein [Pirellulales bacterium]
MLLFSPATTSAADLKTRNVVLITTDGLRWQEVFTGAEQALLNKQHGGVADVKALEAQFWRDTPEARREALLPFFWKIIARQGQLYGNAPKGSSAQITNTKKFSYPGYNEILTGFFDPLIDSNAKKPNQNFTVLEWLHRQPAFGGKVAAYSAWDVIPYVINRERAGFPVMGGWEPLPEAEPNPRQQLLNELIADTTRPNNAEVIDSFLFQAAREHLLRHKPRVLYVGFLETDAWGHAGRYDNLLTSAHAVDGYIQRLWETLQSLDQYRDQTTLIISTDHGRGSGLVDWKNHGPRVEGAENIWIAVLGPDTPPLGERTACDRVTQSQIAATLAALLGEDYHSAVPRSGPAIEQVLPPVK